MNAVAGKSPTDYPWFIRLFFWKQRRTYGHVLDPALLWGRSPWVFASVALLLPAVKNHTEGGDGSLECGRAPF